jgi:lysozyme family protein
MTEVPWGWLESRKEKPLEQSDGESILVQKRERYTSAKRQLDDARAVEQSMIEAREELNAGFGKQEVSREEQQKLQTTRKGIEKARNDSLKALTERHDEELYENLDTGTLETVYEKIGTSLLSRSQSDTVSGWREEIKKELSVEENQWDAEKINKYIQKKLEQKCREELSKKIEEIKKDPNSDVRSWVRTYLKTFWLQDEAFSDDVIKKHTQEHFWELVPLSEGGDETAQSKKMLEIARKDYREYLSICGDNLSLEDLPADIRRQLIWNPDFLEDVDDIPPQLSKEIKNHLQEIAIIQKKIKDVSPVPDARVTQENLNQALTGTGMSSSEIEQSMRRWIDKKNLSPLVRFLADLLAPFWVMMWWETGEFWQKYLNNTDRGAPWSLWSLSIFGSEADTWWWSINAKYAGEHTTSIDSYVSDKNGESDIDVKWNDSEYDGKIREAANTIGSHKAQYEAVSAKMAEMWKPIPWEVIGAIHEREASGNFHTYLHNGDPLWTPTTHIPIWITYGENQWVEAAVDALSRETYIIWMNTTSKQWLANIAEYCERYNGLWYRRKGRVSPYVWAWANFYTGGRYVADSQFSSTSKDSRPGTMPVIIELLWGRNKVKSLP